MKKPVFFLMFALVLLTVSSAFASEIVPLQFSYSPIDFPNIFLLPNGYYQAVYFTPNSSEFWLEQGHTDVSNCIVEVFDAFGQSVWNFPVLQVDILQEDADAFFYQNERGAVGTLIFDDFMLSTLYRSPCFCGCRWRTSFQLLRLHFVFQEQ